MQITPFVLGVGTAHSPISLRSLHAAKNTWHMCPTSCRSSSTVSIGEVIGQLVALHLGNAEKIHCMCLSLARRATLDAVVQLA
jgi:hypothetical protein